MSLTPPAQPIAETYLDSAGVEHRIDPAIISRLRHALGTPPAGAEDTAPIVARRGQRVPVTGRLRLEGGGSLDIDGTVPEDCPLGYHTLTGPAGLAGRQLIVGPGRCYLPDRRAWGWTVQLYAARSSLSWGIGDLGDLRTITRWAAEQGAGFVLVNPLHAVAPTLPQETSPYFPTSRAFRNPVYLRIEDVPGADRVDLREFQQAGRAANAGSLIDRDAVWRIKRAALHRVYSQTRPGEEYSGWRAEQGTALRRFATWCALADRHGPHWRDWPADLRDPDGDAVLRFEREAEPAIGFHAWLQWLLHLQLADLAPGVAVIQDLPIGVDPDGADAWAWQQVMADGVTVGAPPDPFNLSGQDWGLHPFVPWRLRQAGYQPFIEAIRATLARHGGLRIDHVMGLLRLWWIPEGSPPTHGGYVHYPVADLLEIVALESHRFQAMVVGEDLGTVAPGLREEMAARNMLSYRLLWFEEEPPADWPVPALAAVTTHDLPTVAGLWSGADLADQQASGLDADPASTENLRVHLAEVAGVSDGAAPAEVIGAAYRALAQAPSTLLAATLEDAVGVELRPNLPGTTRQRNWSIPLPVLLEDVPALPGVAEIAAVLDRACRAGTDSSTATPTDIRHYAAGVRQDGADVRHDGADVRRSTPRGRTSDTPMP